MNMKNILFNTFYSAVIIAFLVVASQVLIGMN